MVRPFACLMVAVLLAPAAGRAQETFPIPVFVTHVELPPPPFLPPEQHEGVISAARAKGLDLVEQIQKQHGNKTKAWPPEAWKVVNDAEDARTLAVARRDYQRPDASSGLARAVQDFIDGMRRYKEMVAVPNADAAALVVEITGRRFLERASLTEYRYFMRFRLRPGAKMTGDRFLELTRDYDWNSYFSKVIARPTDATGYVDLEAGSPASWENCAGSVHSVVLGFVRARLASANKK